MGGLKVPGRAALLALAAVGLVAGVAGGLARAGWGIEFPKGVALHGALMMTGFLGTVISLERAIALGSWPAFTAPLAAGVGTVLMLSGVTAAGSVAWIIAPLGLVAASAAIVRRQRALHTVLLLGAACAWLAGNILFLRGYPVDAAVTWWFAFLVLTICAERLEMTRVLPRRAGAKPQFLLAAGLLLAGAVVAAFEAALGARIFGVALVALAAWLATYDIARRSVKAAGFPRFAAVGLLAGYFWLAIGGIAWALLPDHPGLREVALHALGVGFVFSMIFAHAPVIIPVVLGRAVAFHPFFHVPLAMLHGSLAVRLFDTRWGSALHVAAIALFIATLVWSLHRKPGDAPPQPRGRR